MFSLRNSCLLIQATLFAGIALAGSPPAGIINHTEGTVTLDGQALSEVGASSAVLTPGHELRTAQGRAEILLTPGIFFRVAENSTVKVDSDSSKSLRVEVVSGEALVEVAEIEPKRPVDIIDKGADARLETPGIYLFNASQPTVAVYAGKLKVDDDRRVAHFGKGEELLLNAGSLKPQKFDTTETDPLYAWSLTRADYSSQVSEWTAESLLLTGPTTYRDGWYWNPWYQSWAFIPERGYHLSPFNYGYYNPNTPQSQTPIFGDFR